MIDFDIMQREKFISEVKNRMKITYVPIFVGEKMQAAK